jgi:arginyl-tRNA--protein-N-Asp/Glu arginylyltransferase
MSLERANQAILQQIYQSDGCGISHNHADQSRALGGGSRVGDGLLRGRRCHGSRAGGPLRLPTLIKGLAAILIHGICTAVGWIWGWCRAPCRRRIRGGGATAIPWHPNGVGMMMRRSTRSGQIQINQLSDMQIYAHDCGYCGGAASFMAEGFTVASAMEPAMYERLLDLGFRRSGHHFYRPVWKLTCCPLRSIRCDVLEFTLSRSQRRLLKRCQAECLGDLDGKVFTRICVTAAAYDAEAFELYRRYQMQVHGDLEEDVTEQGYCRFLCNSPLETTQHLRFFADLPGEGSERLAAVSVIDVTPRYVSSVYNFYDPAMRPQQLGHLTVLYELHLASQRACSFYTLGLYLADNPKLAYKASFRPCQVLSYHSKDSSYRWQDLLPNDQV